MSKPELIVITDEQVIKILESLAQLHIASDEKWTALHRAIQALKEVKTLAEKLEDVKWELRDALDNAVGFAD